MTNLRFEKYFDSDLHLTGTNQIILLHVSYKLTVYGMHIPLSVGSEINTYYFKIEKSNTS